MTAGRLTFRGALLIAVLGCSATFSARIASAVPESYYWNNPSGAIWYNTSAEPAYWNFQTTGGSLVDWSDDSSLFDSTAIFNGTAETVTLGASVNPNVIDFDTTGTGGTTGYTIAPASSFAINMSGTSPTINVGSGAAAFLATISAPLTSTGPLTIADTGTGNTTFTFSGTTTITGGTLNIVGNTNKSNTFTINSPNLSLSTLNFSDTAASTTTLAGVTTNSTITFTGSTPTINSGESGNSSYKDISYITETVIGSSGPNASTTPLIMMNNDANGTQSAVSFGNGTVKSATSQNSFPGGIYLESAGGGTTATTGANSSGIAFSSISLTATGTTRLNFNLPGANGSNVIGGNGTIYVYANGAIITDQGSQQAFTENMSNNIVLNPNGWTPATGIFVTAIGGTKATSGNTEFNYSGTISGNGAILIGNDVGQGSGGAGVTIFSGPQKTYTGETIMNGSVTAIFQMGATNVLPSQTTLMFGNAAPGQDLNNSIGALDLNGFSQSIASLQSNVDPASTINGITNTSGTLATLTITGSTVDTFIGSLGVTSQSLLLGTSNNNEALTRSGSGTTILGSALNGTSSTYVGPTLVNGTSTLEAGSFTAFSPNSNYTIESKLDLAGYNNTINSLASVGTAGVVTTSAANQLTGGATILTIGSNTTLNANTSPNTTFLGVLADGGANALLGLSKAGNGTQVLAGANTYSGPTVVSSGVLTINGSLIPATPSSISSVTVNGGTLNGSGSIASPVAVNASGTLAGSLTVSNAVSVSASGTIAPGVTGTAGTLTVGGLTLFGGSIYDWKVTSAGGTAGSGYDTVAATSVTLDSSAGTTPINVSVSVLDPSFNGSVAQTFQLATASSLSNQTGSSVTNAFNAFTSSNLFGTFSITNPNSTNNLQLNYTPGIQPSVLNWVGGTGTWQAAGTGGDTSWSSGPWSSTGIAEFAHGTTGGTVTLAANTSSPLLQFDTTGYIISGGSSNFTLSDSPATGYNFLRVQVTNSTDSATIGAGIISPLTKYGLGTLILTGGSGNTFGGGALTVYGGTVRGGSTSLNANIANYGTVIIDQNGISGATYAGAITGSGSVSIQNSSSPSVAQTLILSGSSSYTGGTTIGKAVTLSVASTSNLGGSSAGITFDGGSLQTTATNGITVGGFVNVTANDGTISDAGAASVDIFSGGANLQTSGIANTATLTKNGSGILQILGNGWTGSGSIAINAGELLVGNEADANSNPSAFLGGNSLTLGNNTNLTIAAGTASTASITPPNLALNGNVTIALFKTGGLVGQGPLEPALNSLTTINPGSKTASSTITITGSGDNGNSLAGSSNVTLGNTTFSATSGTITFQTVADFGANGISTGLTFGAVTDNGDATVFLGQGNNLASTPVLPGPGIQFNGTVSGVTTATMTGSWTIGDTGDLNGQVVVVAVQRVTNSQLAMTTGNITVNPGSQLSITPATGTYGATSGTQTIMLYGSGPVDNTDTPTGVLTLAAKSTATFTSNVDVVLASSTNPLLAGAVEIDLSNGSSTQQTILTFDGPVTGSAGLDLQGGDLTQLIFAGANNMTGHTHMKGGQIVVDVGSSIGTGALTMEQTSTHNPTLILNNLTQSIGNLSSTYGTQSSPTVPVTQTIQLNGTALTINETDFTGTADYGISPTDGTIVSGSSSIIIGTGSVTYAGAQASAGNPAAYLSLSSTNTYSGGTTVTGGTLATTLGGTLGTGSLSLVAANNNASSLSLGTTQSVASLSNSTTGMGASTLAVASGSTLTVSGNLGNTGTLRIGTVTAPGATSAVGGGTVVVKGSPNLAASSQIQVTTGTLEFDAPTGTSPAVIAGSGGTAASVTVSSGATLQLAGAVSALSGGGNLANVNNNSSATGPGVGGLQVTGTNQSVGIVSGTVSLSGPTTYSGDTVVGPGATFTATQILQNTLTIGAGATVTLAPSAPLGGGGVVTQDDSAAAPVASPGVVSSNVAASSLADPSDPITAIQSAIASGAISSAAGAQLENRLAAIERLATVDPGLNASLLESRILATIPSSSIWSAPTTSTIGESGVGLLAVDSSTFASPGSTLGSASSAFSISGELSGGATAVPEPSSLLLIGLGSLGLAALGLKRKSRKFESENI